MIPDFVFRCNQDDSNNGYTGCLFHSICDVGMNINGSGTQCLCQDGYVHDFFFLRTRNCGVPIVALNSLNGFYLAIDILLLILLFRQFLTQKNVLKKICATMLLGVVCALTSTVGIILVSGVGTFSWICVILEGIFIQISLGLVFKTIYEPALILINENPEVAYQRVKYFMLFGSIGYLPLISVAYFSSQPVEIVDSLGFAISLIISSSFIYISVCISCYICITLSNTLVDRMKTLLGVQIIRSVDNSLLSSHLRRLKYLRVQSQIVLVLVNFGFFMTITIYAVFHSTPYAWIIWYCAFNCVHVVCGIAVLFYVHRYRSGSQKNQEFHKQDNNTESERPNANIPHDHHQSQIPRSAFNGVFSKKSQISHLEASTGDERLEDSINYPTPQKQQRNSSLLAQNIVPPLEIIQI